MRLRPALGGDVSLADPNSAQFIRLHEPMRRVLPVGSLRFGLRSSLHFAAGRSNTLHLSGVLLGVFHGKYGSLGRLVRRCFWSLLFGLFICCISGVFQAIPTKIRSCIMGRPAPK